MPIKLGIPCSSFKGLNSDLPVTCENEAIAFAAGAWIGGEKDCLVFMQNSGFLCCIDIIASLLIPYGIDIKILVSNRDKPAHHKIAFDLTEKITLRLQELGYEKIGLYKKDN